MAQLMTLTIPVLGCIVQFLDLGARGCLGRACWTTRHMVWTSPSAWGHPRLRLLWTTATKLIYGDITPAIPSRSTTVVTCQVNWNKAEHLLNAVQSYARLDDLRGALAGERCGWDVRNSLVLMQRCTDCCARAWSASRASRATDTRLHVDQLPWSDLWGAYAGFYNTPWTGASELQQRIAKLLDLLGIVFEWMRMGGVSATTCKWTVGLAHVWRSRLLRLAIVLHRTWMTLPLGIRERSPLPIDAYDFEAASIVSFRAAAFAGVSAPLLFDLADPDTRHQSDDRVYADAGIDIGDMAERTKSPCWRFLAYHKCFRTLKADQLEPACAQGLVDALLEAYRQCPCHACAFPLKELKSQRAAEEFKWSYQTHHWQKEINNVEFESRQRAAAAAARRARQNLSSGWCCVVQ